MSTAPSPLSLSDFLTSPPPLDLASLPASSSLLARYASSASQHTAGSGSTPAASGGTPSSSAHLAPHPHHFPHDDGGGGGSGGGGRDDAFLDFTLSPGADDQDGFGNNGEGMFGLGQPQQAHQHQHQPPPAQGRQRHQSSLSSSSQPSVPYHTGQQPNGGQQQQSQSQQPLQADLRALFESLGASSADFDLDAASSPSSPAYPHPSQQHSQLVPAHAHQHPHQQPSPGAFQGGPPPAPNGLLELLPQLQQMTAGGALNHAGLGQLQQHLQNQQNQQQHGGGQPMPPDIASLLGLLGVPAFANGNQQQQQQQHGGHSQLNGQGHESAGATIAKLRELQEMQQAQAALIQQQLNQIASFYSTNGQQPGSGSTTSTTSPSGASVQSGSYGQQQQQQQQQSQHGGRGQAASNAHTAAPGESPRFGAQQHGFAPQGGQGKFDGLGVGGGLSHGMPLPTPDHSGELGAMAFSPHLMGASGMMSPVYLPGSNFSGPANGGANGAGANAWRNTGDAYDRDGNLLMTPLISPAMTALSHPTPGSTFQPINPALSSAGANGDFFSPLTSPALGPSQFERGMSLHHHPAAGGGHSYIGTMSPHLLAQRSTPNSPLVNGSIGSSSASSSSHKAGGGGRSVSRGGRPANDGGGNAGGKAASAGRAKTRPSPIIKAVVGSGQPPRRRSTIGPSAVGSPKTVLSPAGAFDHQQQHQHGLAFQGLPASAIPMEVSQSFQSSHQASVSPSSTSSMSGLHTSGGAGGQANHQQQGIDSSPSPIDFASLQMPPPPHPSQLQQQQQQSQPPGTVAPQTPATFLNLGQPAADQRAIYSEGNTVSPGLAAADPSNNGSSSTHGHGHGHPAGQGGAVQSSYAARRESMSGQPSSLAVPAGAGSSSAGWPQPKQAVRIVEKSPLGSPAFGPSDFDKGKGKEVADAKGKKTGKAGAAGTASAAGPKRAAKGAKPPPAASGGPPPVKPETKKTSHKAAEQKRRDSLKAGFDELRLLLPPINVELVDPDTGLPIAGASMPRLPARNLDTGEPNRNVSKVALLRCSNKHLAVLNGRIARRDEWIARLVDNIRQLRAVTGLEGSFEGDDDLFELDVDAVDREDEFGPVGPYPGEDADEGAMADEGELAGLRRMSAEQEDADGLDPVAEEGPEDADAHPSGADDLVVHQQPAPPPPPPPAVSLTRKKSLPKNGHPAFAARRSSAGRAAAMVASDKMRATDDGDDGANDHDMDES